MMKYTTVCLFVALALLPAADSRSGDDPSVVSRATLVIRVLVRGAVLPPKTMEVVRDRQTCGSVATVFPVVVDAATHGLRDAVVEVLAPSDPRTDTAGPVAPPASITNRQCRFEPSLLLVRVGRPLEVRNDDAILHNTRIEGSDRTLLNIAMPIGVSPVAKTIKAPGVYLVHCDAHPFMSAMVVGVAGPFAAATGSDGLTRIPGVPPGQHAVTVQHAVLGSLTQEVIVPAQGTVTVTFEYRG